MELVEYFCNNATNNFMATLNQLKEITELAIGGLIMYGADNG